MEQNTSHDSNETPPKKRRKIIKRFLILIVPFIVVCVFCLYCNNNCSFMNDEEFVRRLDDSIEKATGWVRSHRNDILTRKNMALLRMLQDADQLHKEPLFGEIVQKIMSLPLRPDCWKRLIDPEHPVQYREIHHLIKNEVIDNKWILYAIAPKKAKLTEAQMKDFFDPDRWQKRQLTHQLWALIHLRRSTGSDEKTDCLIEQLCDRITRQVTRNMPIVDIYIQKVAFVLKAGFPQKIKRRWIERIITNQQNDGGWNDRWYCFRSRTRPSFDFDSPASNQHATIQALWLLYQVKYCYPKHFGLEKTP